jgi:hypothetical protein
MHDAHVRERDTEKRRQCERADGYAEPAHDEHALARQRRGKQEVEIASVEQRTDGMHYGERQHEAQQEETRGACER